MPPVSRLSRLSNAPLGRCLLVGAGPGDPELLTLKAIKAIQSATLLLVDDLVSPEVLAYAPASARIVPVGKRAGGRCTPQSFIEKLMLMAAQQGEQVVRLKGGDPFIFGRGGEEAAHLRAAGVEVEVINGITAGLAGITSLGAPLTHRDLAQGVVFITGHAQQGAPATDWQALAATLSAARLTLVIYMGVSGAAQIAEQLQLGGLPAQTPAAIIESASRPEQRQAITTLGQLAATMAAERLGSPSVLVIGAVVGTTVLANQLPAWLERASA